MKIRIVGIPAELDLAVQAVASVLPVVEVSRVYPSRNALLAHVDLRVGPLQTSVMGTEGDS